MAVSDTFVADISIFMYVSDQSIFFFLLMLETLSKGSLRVITHKLCQSSDWDENPGHFSSILESFRFNYGQ